MRHYLGPNAEAKTLLSGSLFWPRDFWAGFPADLAKEFMKSAFISIAVASLLAAWSANGQGAGGGGSGGGGAGTGGGTGSGIAPSAPGQPGQPVQPNNGNLPPGLENRQQLPPGLQDRNQLPPGLAMRTNQFGVGTNQFGFNTNQFGFNSNQFGFNSNQFGMGTNQFGGIMTNQLGTNLSPTGRGFTNRVFGTNTGPPPSSP